MLELVELKPSRATGALRASCRGPSAAHRRRVQGRARRGARRARQPWTRAHWPTGWRAGATSEDVAFVIGSADDWRKACARRGAVVALSALTLPHDSSG